MLKILAVGPFIPKETVKHHKKKSSSKNKDEKNFFNSKNNKINISNGNKQITDINKILDKINNSNLDDKKRAIVSNLINDRYLYLCNDDSNMGNNSKEILNHKNNKTFNQKKEIKDIIFKGKENLLRKSTPLNNFQKYLSYKINNNNKNKNNITNIFEENNNNIRNILIKNSSKTFSKKNINLRNKSKNNSINNITTKVNYKKFFNSTNNLAINKNSKDYNLKNNILKSAKRIEDFEKLLESLGNSEQYYLLMTGKKLEINNLERNMSD